jgi:hypothetical protein
VADADPSNDSPWRTAIYSEKEYKPDWPIGPKADSGKYVPPWEAVREENLIYIRHGDDPWTSVNDAGFIEVYDLSTDPHELRNLAHYGEVPQATLDRLEGRLLRLRSCQAEECRAAEDDAPPSTDPVPGPPRVTNTVPAHNATGVAPSANLTATFSEKMDPLSITNSTFKLFKVNPDGSTTQITNVTVAPSTDGLKATLNPFGTSTTTHLARGTKYKAVITTGAKDVAGNPLDQNPTTSGNQQMEWFFKTGLT